MYFFAPNEAVGTTIHINSQDSNFFQPNQDILELLKDSKQCWALKAQHPCRIDLFQYEGDIVNTELPLCDVQGSINGVEISAFGIWMASHAAFRGIQAESGEGGQIAARATPIEMMVVGEMTVSDLVSYLPSSVIDGDVITISEKIVAISQGRVGPRKMLAGRDPKFLNYKERLILASELQSRLGFEISTHHLTLIDHLPAELMTLGTDDANGFCERVAREVWLKRSCRVDVLVVDSDTGVDLCQPLTGLPTVGASPIGSTAGLTYYECLRASTLAEFARGHTKGTPIVVVHPSERNRARSNIGEYRGYRGDLKISMEQFLHHAVPNLICWEQLS